MRRTARAEVRRWPGGNESKMAGVPARPTTPTIPQAAELGPWPHFTGTNVEIHKDTHGIFRYTQVRVFFDSIQTDIGGPEGAEAIPGVRSAAVARATKIAAQIINYLLDVYRSITGEHHV